MRKKICITVTALALVLCFAIGGTLAWLMDKTDSVQNTFTAGDVDITLVETWNTDSNNNGENDSWSAQMIPGNTYAKDPKVTVVGSEDAVDCWLFVKVEEKGNAQDYLNYSFTFDDENSGWTQLSTSEADGTTTTVWYREVTASTADQSWYLLDGNEDYTNGFVSVDANEVTKSTVDEAAEAELVFTAYAVQKDNLTVEEAWAKFAN
ncbi:MAG: hypothetical protein IJ439_04510 [Tyzzerella sp.]|nr:hypothetical protein [Tyzzerella sp.]